jgi:hypothetical protein
MNCSVRRKRPSPTMTISDDTKEFYRNLEQVLTSMPADLQQNCCVLGDVNARVGRCADEEDDYGDVIGGSIQSTTTTTTTEIVYLNSADSSTCAWRIRYQGATETGTWKCPGAGRDLHISLDHVAIPQMCMHLIAECGVNMSFCDKESNHRLKTCSMPRNGVAIDAHPSPTRRRGRQGEVALQWRALKGNKPA